MNIFINKNEQRLRAGWRLLVQLLVMIFLYGTGVILLTSVLPRSWPITSALPLLIGICLSVWFAARYIDRRPLSQYGIHFNKRWAREFMAGAVIAAIAIAVIFLIEWWAGWITITHYGWDARSHPSFGAGLAMFFIAMLMVGFYEELFSRGYQILNLNEGLHYPGMPPRIVMATAVLLSSSLFGLLHFFNPNASVLSTFNIILAGIVLAIPYVLTGSLALSAGLHFSWNFVMAGVAGFPVSGLAVKTSVLHLKQTGPTLWTGGLFGPEAGILGWLGMGFMLAASCAYIKQAGYERSIAPVFTKKYQGSMKSDEQSL